MDELRTGDTIRCKTPKEAAEIADALCNEHYDWDFIYDYDEGGQKVIILKVLGRID